MTTITEGGGYTKWIEPEDEYTPVDTDEYAEDEYAQPPAKTDTRSVPVADGIPGGATLAGRGMARAHLGWYEAHGPLSYRESSIIAQNWLVQKACSQPAKDALRNGWRIDSPHEDEYKSDDRSRQLSRLIRYCISQGRVYGVRHVLYQMAGADDEFYEAPYNPDSAYAYQYAGFVQLDPTTVSPCIDSETTDHKSPWYMKPQWWSVHGRKIHCSHMFIYVPFPVSESLLSSYHYGGQSVPQYLYRRAYAADRLADEGEQLAVTKRTMVYQTADVGLLSRSMRKLRQTLSKWVSTRDNYGVLAVSNGETLSQTDISLTDVDSLMMSEYQVASAVSYIPFSKLMGSSPKGFQSTGEYEQDTYHEELETIQADILPLLDGHYRRLAASMGHAGEPTVDFEPVDSPTTGEWATINAQKAQTDQLYWNIGAVSDAEIRNRLQTDPNSDYYGLTDTTTGSTAGATPAAPGGPDGGAASLLRSLGIDPVSGSFDTAGTGDDPGLTVAASTPGDDEPDRLP